MPAEQPASPQCLSGDGGDKGDTLGGDVGDFESDRVTVRHLDNAESEPVTSASRFLIGPTSAAEGLTPLAAWPVTVVVPCGDPAP